MVTNVLFIVNKLPYPIYKDGITLINYRLLEKAPSTYRFHLVAYSNEDESVCNMLYSLFPQIDKIEFIKPYSRLLNQFDLVLYTLFGFRLFTNRQMSKIEGLELYDLIYFCVPPSPIYYRKLNTQVPVFVNAVDSFSLLNERFYQYRKTIFAKIKTWLYRNAEKKCFLEASLVNFVSDVDQRYVQKIAKLTNAISITNGVDTNYYSFGCQERDECSVLFVGNYDYKPNVDAVDYFVSNIYPVLKSIHSELKFYIVGINPPFDFQDSDIVVTGFVSDIRDYYHKCTVFVSPLMTGSGMKNKVLEAMSSGIPVISTPIGADGINGLVSKQNIEIAKNANEMIDALDLLLKYPKQRIHLSSNARMLIETHYDWNAIIAQYYLNFDEIIKQK